MPSIQINNIRIAGISACVPKQIVKTISTTDKYDDESYIESVGVKEKRFSNEFTASDLCESAAHKLITDLKWDKEDVELLIMVTQTPDYILPATSCVLHGKLGLKKSCMCLDINLGCSGWVYGLSVALSLMSSGKMRRALFLAGDARKQVPEEHDQLFGYAGTVTALEYDESAAPISFDLGTDGSGYDAIIRPGGGARNPITAESLELHYCEDGRLRHACQTRMKGMDVFAFGITTAPKSIKKLLSENGQEISSVDYFVFHQANKKMLDTIAKKLKLREEQVPLSLTKFGNTSSASIPLTIVTELRGSIVSDTTLVGCGFGVGLSWGTVLFHTGNNMVISELQEL